MTELDFTPNRQDPKIEEKLRIFISYVDRGEIPPQALMQFMADGAREFLMGGKPWQRGNGGRKKSPFGRKELEAHILHFYGGLSHSEIVTLRDHPDDGRDYTKTIGREIGRGGLVFALAKSYQESELIKSLSALAELPFDELPPARARECRERLKSELRRFNEGERQPRHK